LKLKTLIPKSEVRRIVVQRRKGISADEIRSKTKLIVERLIALDDFISAKKVHSYISTKTGEFDTRYIIDFMSNNGKSIVIPKLNKQSKKFQHASFIGWNKLVKNSEGYYEPPVGYDDDLSGIDLMIVPAIAVSVLGQRVGYGGGYYDLLLKNTGALKIVPAFEFQVFDNIETEVHDMRIDKIVTELRVINTRQQIKQNSESV